MKGTITTMAPEIIHNWVTQQNGSYTSKVDLWSIGVVFFYLLKCSFPFNTESKELSLLDIQKKTEKENFKFIEQIPHANEESKDLLKKLLQPIPDDRIDWKGFFDHPIFEKVNSELSEFNFKSKIFGLEKIRNWETIKEFYSRKHTRDSQLIPLHKMKISCDMLPVKQLEEIKIDTSQIDSNAETFNSQISKSKNRRSKITDFGKSNKKVLAIKIKDIRDIEHMGNHLLNRFIFVSEIIHESKYYFKKHKFFGIQKMLWQFFNLVAQNQLDKVKEICNSLISGKNIFYANIETKTKNFYQSSLRESYLKVFQSTKNYFNELIDSINKICKLFNFDVKEIASLLKTDEDSHFKKQSVNQNEQNKKLCFKDVRNPEHKIRHKEIKKLFKKLKKISLLQYGISDELEVNKFRYFLFKLYLVVNIKKLTPYKDKLNEIFDWNQFSVYIRKIDREEVEKILKM